MSNDLVEGVFCLPRSRAHKMAQKFAGRYVQTKPPDGTWYCVVQMSTYDGQNSGITMVRFQLVPADPSIIAYLPKTGKLECHWVQDPDIPFDFDEVFLYSYCPVDRRTWEILCGCLR